ncbi:MAG: hypothetical protein QNI96_05195 [Woeseiaceae bacterium]|nr:hypothetical protein [Woeseiaceae bacterium]
MKAHQRLIREEKGQQVNRPVVPLSLCRVEPITREQAEAVILEYEWLGTMPTGYRCAYGLVGPDDEVLGASVFANPPGSNSAALCGEEHRSKVVCLARGACVPWSHEHAPSYQTAVACKMARRDHGWQIFVGYSDERAGEIGTIYQACNWVYLGVARKGGRKVWVLPNGDRLSTRAARSRYPEMKPITMEKMAPLGWSQEQEPDKARYVWFEGSKTDKKRLRRALRYPAQPYPKRRHDYD